MISYEVRPPGTFPSVGVLGTGRLEWRTWASPCPVVVAHVRGVVVGVLVHDVNRGLVDVHIVWVRRSMRRRGIARRMLSLVNRSRGIAAKAITTAGREFLLASGGGARVQDCRHRSGVVR